MAASIESLLGEISGVEHPIEELQLLKTALLAKPVSALRDSVSGHRFNVIFALLNSDRRSVFISYLWFGLFYLPAKMKGGELLSQSVVGAH